MMKNIFITSFLAILALPSYSQGSSNFPISDKQDTSTFTLQSYNEKEDTYKRSQVVIGISPPGFFSYPTYKIALANSQEFNGRIPPSFMNFNIFSQVMLTNRLALGINYKYSHFRINDTYLKNLVTNSFEKTNVNADLHNVLLYCRFYYLIRPHKNFDNKVIFYSGAGIGVGQINWIAETGGKYNFFSVPGSENTLYHFDLIGIDKPFAKHFVFSMVLGFGSNGLANMAIQYKIFTNHL